MNDLGSSPHPAPPFRKMPTLMLVVLCSAFLTLGALFFVWQRFQFVRLGFEVDRLRQREFVLRQEIEPLEVESQYLSRPERIEVLARERLGLRPPRPSQIIVLESRETNSSRPR